MPITPDDKYKATIVVKYLRCCLEDPAVPDRCKSCPFDDGVHNCIDYLHTTAADLLEKLAGLRRG